MKLSCDREKLLETFQIAQNITPKKTSKPILKNVKMDAFEKNLKVTATNIELTMKRTLEAGAVGKEGSILVSGRDMTDILRETDSDEIFMTVQDNSVLIKTGEAQFTIQSNIAEEFFNTADIKTDFEINVPTARLAEMINQTIFTAGKETMAYTFEGIMFNIEKDVLEIVGTDGKRIAIASEKVDNKKGKEHKALVPIQTLRTLLNIISTSSDETMKIKVGGNHIIFQDGSTELISQLIEGRFPEYRNYIPDTYKYEGTFGKDSLISGIRKADIMTSMETHLIKFNFNKKDMVLNMTSRCLDKGASEVNIPIEKLETESDEGLVIGFNGRHILDVLKVVDEDRITWKIKEEQGPGEISKGDKFRYVFMPVKLS